MFKLSDVLKRTPNAADAGVISEGQLEANSASNNTRSNPISTVRNWYEERYDNLVVQRNLLMILLGVAVIVIAVSVLAVAQIATSKEFDPFVIQVDEQTGATKIVNPLNSEVLNGNEALARYFIKRYVTARETYNPVDFESQARKIVRLLSTRNVFQSYLGYIKDKDNDPTIFYGQKNTTYLTVRSWSKLDTQKYVVRFSISETSGSMRVFNKIAIVDIDYVAMELKDDERDINPVGFQITAYRVDNDNS